MHRDAAAHHASDASSPLASTTASTPSGGFFSPVRRRPSPLSNPSMGQAESTPARPAASLGLSPKPAVAPSPQPTSKYRFGWPGRRKKSEDLTRVMGASTYPGPSPPPTAASPPPNSLNNTSMGRELARQASDVSSSSLDSHSAQEQQQLQHMHELSRPASRSSAKQLTMQFASNTLTALKGKLNASQASIHSLRTAPLVSPTSPPPPLPPKPSVSRLSSSASSSQSGNSSADWVALDNKPLPSPTPDATAPVPATVEITPQQVIIPTTTAASAEHDVSPPQRREREHREGADTQTAKNIADDWRKSDSTLRTVRLVGSRTPRPLSLAESTNSGQTVLPTVGAGSPMNIGPSKRLSALITDAEYGVAEVDSEDDEDEDNESSAPPSAFSSVNSLQQQQTQSASSSWSSSPTPMSGKPQPARRRSSLSIRIGRFSGTKGRVSEHGHMSGSDSEALSSSVSTRDTGIGMSMHTANSSLTSVSSSSPGAKESRPSIEIASSASIASSMSSDRRPEQYAQYKANARLEPWITLPATHHTASESQASLSTSESASTSSHVSKHADTEKNGVQRPATSQGATLRPAHQRTRLQSIQARGFRQTAVSFTTGLAPAAGFARKAVDRLGRALGGSATSLTNSDAGEMNGNGNSHPPSALGANAELLGLAGHNQHAHARSRRSHHAQQNSHPQLAHGHPPSSAKKAFRRHVAKPSSSWSIGSNSNSASDTDGPGGPKLGRRVRGPLMTFNNGKGLVFGRELVLCVQDTACETGVETDVDGLSLEGRSLPALVVRCAQHIVKWGVQEEGLFRISGRSTHVSKLRTEFDSGADYDLRECGPGEIDPHAVSSILKAYLRELPEPLLTRHLMPYFDAALMAETHMINVADAQSSGNPSGAERSRGQGLPSSPRDSVQVRKAPSLSTFAVPTLSPRSASQTLLHALAALVARLPKENRDLLQTVTELISATARASRETKMPLSNLLLVFCPSLMMSPPLLRVLCEAKEIWDGPLADVQIPVVGDVPSEEKTDEDEREEKEGDDKDGDDKKGLHYQGTIRRSPRTSDEHVDVKANKKEDKTVALPSLALPSLVLPSDAPSTRTGVVSAVSGHTKTDSSISAPFTLSSPTGLTVSTSSSDSFETPPSSNSSPNMFLAPSVSVAKSGLDTAVLNTKVFALHAQSDLPSPLSPCAAKKAVRKSLIGNPVPFPMGLGMGWSSSGNGNGSAGSAPVTPIDLSGSDRLSLASHSSSSPNLSSRSATGMTPPRLGRRKSKASLLALKSKRSLSSLLGLSQAQTQMQTPQMLVPERESEDTGSESSPRRPSTPCPVLDLPVDTSRTGLGLGLSLTDEPKSLASSNVNVSRTDTLEVPSPTPAPRLRPQGSVMDRAASDSSALTNSVFYTPPTTARALAPAQTLSTASSSSSGSYSFLDFNIGKSGDEEEDWARSVLKAASGDA